MTELDWLLSIKNALTIRLIESLVLFTVFLFTATACFLARNLNGAYRAVGSVFLVSAVFSLIILYISAVDVGTPEMVMARQVMLNVWILVWAILIGVILWAMRELRK